jgi:hypothetical protein
MDPASLPERLIAALDSGAVGVERLDLPDAAPNDPTARRHVARRWAPTSPLHRAAHAVLADLERRGIDPCALHLHGQDVEHPVTPYFAGFQLRYFRAIPQCLGEHHGVEWTEVVHPTRTRPLHALRITPRRADLLTDAYWT